MADNAFIRVDDWPRAQALADTLSPDQLHRTLDRYAERCCPVSDVFGQSYHWSLMQVEYATDLVFRSATTLGPLYEQLVRESVLSVKAEQIATFLGRQITPLLTQEVGSLFSTRIEGTCIKHRFGKCSIKMYDKCGIVLRIETTTNDVSFFKHHRKVEHREGPPTRARRQAEQASPRIRYRRPADRRTRPERWRDAVTELLALRAKYAAWCDALPDSLRDNATAEALQAIVELDLGVLADIQPPRGFGRD